MPCATGEQPIDERMDGSLEPRDQITPRTFIAALGTAQRQLVELVVTNAGGGVHRQAGITRECTKGSNKLLSG